MRVMMYVCLIVLACATTIAQAVAQQTPPAPPAPTTIDGFRSAKFGATDAQVRAAIKADFKVNDAAIKASTHPVEQTLMLTVAARDLVAGSGEAQVTYVFGFKSKTLMLVNILWTASDQAGAEVLIGVGSALRDYFLAQTTRFVKEQTKANVSLPDGRNVLFHGADDKGHAVELLLALTAKPPVQGQPADTRPASAQLRLVYVLSPTNTDIQRIQPGQF